MNNVGAEYHYYLTIPKSLAAAQKYLIQLFIVIIYSNQFSKNDNE